MNVGNRRERLLRILALKGRATISELANELEVSERTIMRDIEVLSIEKPIFTVAGKHGGVCIDDYYLFNQLHMKEHEIDLLAKIVSDIENHSSCSLNESELDLLKEIVTVYSKKTYRKEKTK